MEGFGLFFCFFFYVGVVGGGGVGGYDFGWVGFIEVDCVLLFGVG